MIQLKDLWFKYPDSSCWVLRGISLEIREGEFVSLIGPNGSGKSTLAETLNGLLLPGKGEVLVDGISSSSNPWSIRQKVGMVFQNPDHQLFHGTVEEDVAFGPQNLGLPEDQVAARVKQALAAVGMEGFRAISPEKLSAGQKQAVAIAGALAMGPKYLVLDEPTSLLDPANRKRIFDTISGLNRKEGYAILWITQDMEEAALAERILLLDQGRILIDGEPDKVFQNNGLLSRTGLEMPRLLRLKRFLSSEKIDLGRTDVKIFYEKLVRILR